jgi:hypothetical protein
MSTGVYCMCKDEHRSNAILTALREVGFNTEISVVIGDNAESRDMSLKENVVRGVKFGSALGALVALALPGIGQALVIGPLLAALTGAAAGGAVGGLAGGSGAVGRAGLPPEIEDRLKHGLSKGEILISVHTSDPSMRRKALDIFRIESAEYIYDQLNAA